MQQYTFFIALPKYTETLFVNNTCDSCKLKVTGSTHSIRGAVEFKLILLRSLT